MEASDRDLAMLSLLCLLVGGPVAFVLFRDVIMDPAVGFNPIAFMIFVLGIGSAIGFLLLTLLLIAYGMVKKAGGRRRA